MKDKSQHYYNVSFLQILLESQYVSIKIRKTLMQ